MEAEEQIECLPVKWEVLVKVETLSDNRRVFSICDLFLTMKINRERLDNQGEPNTYLQQSATLAARFSEGHQLCRRYD